jgi:hypothetical protein
MCFTMHPSSKAGWVVSWAVGVIACTGSSGPASAAAQDAAVPGRTEAPPEFVEKVCRAVACGSSVSFETKFDESVKTLKSSTLTICFNDSCLAMPLKGMSTSLTPDGGITSGFLWSTPQADPAPGQPALTVVIDPHPEGGMLLRTSYLHGTDSGLKDGDVYSFTIETPRGRKLLDVRRTVTYQASNPSGCRTCFNATLN